MRSAVVAVGVFVALTSFVIGGNVVQFKVEDAEQKLFDFLMKTDLGSSSGRLGSFKYINCGNPKTEILNISSLILGPDPITFPGTLDVQFKGQIKSTIDAPLQAIVKLSRRVGSTWIKIPCIGNIGSCNYKDLCELLAGITCPPPFQANKIPCKCPFTPGNYTFPKSSFDVDAAVFPPGDYHATANLTSNTQFVGCVELYASFA